MKNLLTELKSLFENSFNKCGFEINGGVSILACGISGMGDYQCNDALKIAKNYGKSPREIALIVIENLDENSIIEKVEMAGPGFINITINNDYLANFIHSFMQSYNENMDIDNKNIIIDYGGANVAKPLHVGHLRTAIIGESIKRICKFAGNNTLGDVHLGDWGLQMGMVISELHRRMPNLPYFDPDYTGDYPANSPISIQDLATLYPEASAKAKSDENLMNEAKQATLELQNGRRGYVALWKHIMDISKADLKKNYDNLNVDFDLWLGESDSKKYYEEIIPYIEKSGLSRVSEGALVVDVAEPDDKIEVPPFILKKTDGAVLYSTTDLATIVQREQEYNANRIIYVVDNRQEMHFKQLFRCVRKTHLLKTDMQLDFVGFGTMNGKDGKPYKTRDGGVMQLNMLIEDVKAKAYEKVLDAKSHDASYTQEEMKSISDTVAISALKFADLSIFRTKDYIFDVDKFCSFEGKTGPYLLYTITRAKSILRKWGNDISSDFDINYVPRDLVLSIIDFKEQVKKAYLDLAPSYLCDYVYVMANSFNSFYNSCNIINEKDIKKQNTWLNLTKYTLDIIEKVLDLLAIKTLDKM